MLNRIKEKFTHSLAESVNLSNYKKINADDMSFLTGVGKYIFDRSVGENEENFRQTIITAKRNSYLFDLLRNESRKRLKNQDMILSLIDVNDYDEEIGNHMLRRMCIYPHKLMIGSLDPELLVKYSKSIGNENTIVGEFELDNNNIMLYMPCLLDWLKDYESVVKLSPRLESIKNVLEDFNWKKEIIAKHDADSVGEIVYVK